MVVAARPALFFLIPSGSRGLELDFYGGGGEGLFAGAGHGWGYLAGAPVNFVWFVRTI